MTPQLLDRVSLQRDEDVRPVEAMLRTAEITTALAEALFRLLERHPDYDFGAPGAVVHFLESMDRADYEQLLLDSFKRQPTTHTTWMLHRLMNACSGAHYARLKEELLRASRSTDESIARRARELLSVDERERA